MAVIVLILCISVICNVFSTAQADVKWCVTSQPESAKCESLRKYLADNHLTQLRCIKGGSRYECWRYIKNGDADLIRVDDTEIYSAGKLYDLKPVAKETFSSDSNAETFMYKAVVVVKADGPIKSLEDLRGKKSCHTGVGRTVGWTIPVSSLLKEKIMPQADCDNTVKSVAAFFSQSCAPTAFTSINDPYDDNPTNICEICQNKLCPKDEQFFGYLGAFKCLNDGMGDVAFVKHRTIDDAVDAGINVNKENLRLLCRDGSLKHVNEWNMCNWATRPTDVIMTSSSKNEMDIGQLRTFLESLNASASVGFFQSGSGGKDLMFTDGINHLIGIGKSQANYKTYLEPGYLTSMENYTYCGINFRWCVKTAVEKDKCNDMKAALISKRITREMECVDGASNDDCIEQIEQGTADVMTLGAKEVYSAGRYENLVPISAENYKDIGEEGTSYWAVAVVRKQNRGVNINNLKGTKSCHTGIMKQTGWILPVGFLIAHGQMAKTDKCNMAVNVGNFFKESCVPGALNPKYNPDGTNPKNLCSLCGGEQFCHRNVTNKYYSYIGALRCLVEKNADVAFVKHTTVMDVVNGDKGEPWSASLTSTDFELLCLDGSRQPVTEWATCNLARVPSQAVVTNKKKSETIRKHYQRVLNKAQYYYNNQSSIFNFFQPPSGSKDVIFKDKIVKLTNIPPLIQNYKTWLGAEYLKALEAIDVHQCTSNANPIGQTQLSLVVLFAAIHIVRVVV
ncbi:hypothetical protein LOTGIDRAFT_234865 [Lottia gigantea]|uniref:Transferrin-like domain-containing protein n=1 Tax=Lottia gigantea TaxID=225164 RepID=V4BH56_LOTGI|nr:hypothetical protein LOTGIDRAFT_234865 [Lottia gigantea]ESO87859.1 hypothetical protein LOTGIDRAFT_234865 [Lottia gigantea]